MGSVLSALLGPEGPLVGRLEGYQPRAGQVDMALAVERALTEPTAGDPAHLLATLRRSRARLKGLYLTDEELQAARASGRA